MNIEKLSDKEMLLIFSEIYYRFSASQDCCKCNDVGFYKRILLALNELIQHRLASGEVAGVFRINDGKFVEATSFIEDSEWPVTNGLVEVFITPMSSVSHF
ncbi:hypothetical protein L2C17_001564 [Salmonella enterica subsp. enterica serovar Sandiego]|nr:hypothetical protein [Salmonella enterica subsp. enterica serovar Sandiego]EIT4520852.1 hypothetical protein [Salmonella enterica subsp. enterica serovar Sandiego]